MQPETARKPPDGAPQHADVLKTWRNLADAGNLADAEATLRAAVQRAPESGPYLRLLSETRRRQGQAGEAVVLARQAVRLDSADPESHLHLGLLHLRLGNLAAAREAVEAALRVAPDHRASMLRMSEIALRQGDPDGAHGWADAILRVAPGNAPAFMARAAVHVARNELAYAAAAIGEALRLAPGNPAWTRQLDYVERLLQA